MTRLRLLPLLLAMLAAPVAAQEWRIQWARDPETNCRVWSPEQVVNFQVRWLGPCPNGYATGRGVAIWYADGRELRRDEGDFRDGKLAGFGVRVERDGSRYEGTWRASRAHGEGRLVAPDGNIFEGFWNNGCLNNGSRPAGVGIAPIDCNEGRRTNAGP
jgi:hypothetical protein